MSDCKGCIFAEFGKGIAYCRNAKNLGSPLQRCESYKEYPETDCICPKEGEQ